VARDYFEAGRALRHAGRDAAVVALEEVGLFDYLAASADETSGSVGRCPQPFPPTPIAI
jgi:hypothetical protein